MFEGSKEVFFLIIQNFWGKFKFLKNFKLFNLKKIGKIKMDKKFTRK